LGISATGLAVMLITRIWWKPHAPAAQLPGHRVGLMPGDADVWWALTFLMGALLIAVLLVTALALCARGQRAERQREQRFAAGFMAPLTLGLACVSGGIFAGGVNLLLPSLLIAQEFRNTAPALSGSKPAGYPLVLPVPVYGFMAGLLFLAGIVAILIIVGGIWFWRQSWRKSRVDYLQQIYDEGRRHNWDIPAGETKSQRWSIAMAWTEAEIADHLGKIVTALSLAGIAGVVLFDVLAQQLHVYLVTSLAHIGQWAGLAVVGYLYARTRKAFTDSGTRRIIGVLWDIGTFWPRASQPFAPPCYMERSVPETVNRLRRALGDEMRTGPGKDAAAEPLRDPDPATDAYEAEYLKEVFLTNKSFCSDVVSRQKWILINGYSQGSPIAAAVIAQLPKTLRTKVLHVTVGSPLRRLYGRAFPAYFGQSCLRQLADLLGNQPAQDASPREPEVTSAASNVLVSARWRNIRRPSDYIGSYIFSDPMPRSAPERSSRLKVGRQSTAAVQAQSSAEKNDIDVLVLDPPRIIPAATPTPPPIHRHSDFWPDPQVAVITTQLLKAYGHLTSPTLPCQPDGSGDISGAPDPAADAALGAEFDLVNSDADDGVTSPAVVSSDESAPHSGP
jgi:hypothetical protein